MTVSRELEDVLVWFWAVYLCTLLAFLVWGTWAVAQDAWRRRVDGTERAVGEASWLARLDARARRWRTPLWGLFVGMKWSLVVLGGFMLTFHYAKTWGWAAGSWMLLAPALYGALQGLQQKPPPD